MNEPILVTGASGRTGAEVLNGLIEAGAAVRAGMRNPAAHELPDGATALRFDITDATTYAGAFDGIQRVFLMWPPSSVREAVALAINAAREAGVEQVVFLSVLGADKLRIVPHRSIERLLENSGMDWVFLRAAYFMQNLSTVHAEDIRERDEIFLPAGRGTTGFVDVRDVAAAAVRALVEGRRNRAYTLTGPEALTYAQVADILAEVLGRPIRYSNPSLWHFVRTTRRRGTSGAMTAFMSAEYTATRLRLTGHVTGTTAQVLGRPATTMRRFADDYAVVWRR